MQLSCFVLNDDHDTGLSFNLKSLHPAIEAVALFWLA
jgi:hypothetical protein